MKEFFFEKRGICYRINEFQIGRPTLVCVHGLSGSLSAWFAYEPLFAERYNLLTFDLRGHGESTRPPRYADYELKNYADDVRELLDSLHIEQCILISHSLGALVVLEYVSVHNEKVSALIFLSPSAFLGQTRWFPLVRTLGRTLAALCRILPFHTSMRGRADYSLLGYTADWDLRRIVRDIYITSIHAYLYCLVQSYTGDYDELWKQIAVPTLIIHGTNDSYIPVEHSMRLAKEIQGSKLIVLQGANHITVLNNLSEVSIHITHFLTAL